MIVNKAHCYIPVFISLNSLPFDHNYFVECPQFCFFLKLHHDLIQVIYLVENPLITFFKSFLKFLTVLAVWVFSL